ncbi:hypothetical protein NL676_012303 [Syzygium grande]|nr:hypothetical protein NL676_012303 [Syzygium grande]
MPDEDEAKKANGDKQKTEVKSTPEIVADSQKAPQRGMALAFLPLSVAFNHVNYHVDMPAAVPWVPKIRDGYNPATWKLEITAPQVEAPLGNALLDAYELMTILHVAIETIYAAIQTIVYTLLLYPMIGFELKAGKFLWFYYYILMCFVYFSKYGMMVVALTPGHQITASHVFLPEFLELVLRFSHF